MRLVSKPNHRHLTTAQRRMTAFSLVIGLLVSVMLGLTLSSGTARAQTPALPPPLPTVGAPAGYVTPTQIPALRYMKQAVIVQAPNRSTTYARLTAWQVRDGAWHLYVGPQTARLGWSGLSNRAIGDRRQNDGSTPTGAYPFRRAFGSGSSPGTKLAWRTFDGNDYWVYDKLDPKTYNTYQVKRAAAAKWRMSQAERLASYGKQYQYVMAIDFNPARGIKYIGGQNIATQRANTALGGGIFLHVNGKGATAGCVSVPKATMVKLLRWVDPAHGTRIVIGTPGVLRASQ